MKTFLRVVLLLVTIGACYLLGRWQADWPLPESEIKTATTAKSKTTQASKKQKPPVAYFTNLDEICALFADPNRTWDDKWAYFNEALMPGIDPKNLPAVIKLITDLKVPGNEVGDKNSILGGLFYALAPADPEATLSLLQNYPHLENRTWIIAEALGEIAIIDPQQAFRLLAKLPSSDIDAMSTYRALFSTWAGADPAAAAAAALELPPGPKRSSVLLGVGDTWGQADLPAAIQWAQNLPPGNAQVLNEMIEFALRMNAGSGNFDAASAQADLNLVTDLSKRNAIINEIADYLSSGTDRSRVPAIDWLNQNASGVAYDQAINQIFSMFNNPATLPAALQEVTDPGARAGAIDALAKRWGQINPGDALAWVQTLPDADATARTGAVDAILTTLAKTNPSSAAAFVQNAADPSAYLAAAPAIAQQLAATDPQGAFAWASNLPEGAGKSQAIGSVLGSMAQTDLATAWTYASNLPAGDNQNTVMDSIVNATAQKDPAQAVKLAEQIPDGSAQLTAISSIAAAWVKLDPQAFTVWLNGLPVGDSRDAAIAQLVSSPQAQKNPDGVTQWVNSVNNPQTKAMLLQKLGEK